MVKVTERRTGNGTSLANLYRSFADDTFQSIVRTTPEGRIVFCNDEFARTFGYPSARKARGAHFPAHFPDPSQFLVTREELRQNRRLVAVKKKLSTVCGNPVVGLINANVKPDGSGNPMLNWTILDVTSMEESEQNLHQKKTELDKVNGMMEKFLYSTSHDLRSPVTSILGLVHLMKIETRDRVLHDYIEKIEICAGKLDMIIRDLMGFTKTSYQRSRSGRINIRAMIGGILGRYAEEPNYPSIAFDVSTEETFPFYSDPDRFEIILENVIRNAIHFSDRQKARSMVRITAVVGVEETRIEVHDNGIGIGKQHQSQIFNMFFKASSLSRGAGLGLYITKESVQQMHGSVSVESEPGFGSIFRIMLPNDNKGKLIGRKLLLKRN